MLPHLGLLEWVFVIDCVEKLLLLKHVYLSGHLAQSHNIVIIFVFLGIVVVLTVVFVEGNCPLLSV
jgi:hypothetical protein